MQLKIFIKHRRLTNTKRESISRSESGRRSGDVQTAWQREKAKILKPGKQSQKAE